MDLFGERLKTRVAEAIWESDRERGVNGAHNWPSYDVHMRAFYSGWSGSNPYERYAEVAMRTIQSAVDTRGGA